ncbi:MAG: 4Fe-4S binding protein [Bacteroidales bacterium]|nr:4Fe-4S binding protein [Bacteroidales bacterium]
MAKRILIDLSRYRSGIDNNQSPAEAVFYPEANLNGLKTIRELAVFQFTCRKCEDAPCINVCPSEALEKDLDGLIHRFTNLCISCKSCVTICPFGTMMTDFFIHKINKDLYFDLTDDHELNEFIKACPAGVVTMVDMDENPEENIYKLNDRVLIKENIWNTDKQ